MRSGCWASELLPPGIGDVALRPDLLGLGEPGLQLVVDVLGPLEPEAVEVVVRLEMLDAREAVALDRLGEDQMGVEVALARGLDSGEAHPRLQRDPALRSVDGDRPELTRRRQQRVERGPHV